MNIAIIGAGTMARSHLKSILLNFPETKVRYTCEPSAAQVALNKDFFKKHKRTPPKNIPDLKKLLASHGDKLDAVFILSPHVFHYEQSAACLEAGLDVLLEKPMVMSAEEAKALIEIRNRTGRLLVVSFQGSLSPAIRHAAKLLHSGEFGAIQNVNGVIWQHWNQIAPGTWRAKKAISGGGFLFDCGAHLMNTITDLVGENFVEIAAWLDNRGYEVEMQAVAMGRLASGAYVTFNACGTTIPTCESDIRVFCEKGILRTGAWGRFLEIQRNGEGALKTEKVPQALGVWEQFLTVREGRMENPSPPEVGLRMAHLYDAIHASAAQGGKPVQIRY